MTSAGCTGWNCLPGEESCRPLVWLLRGFIQCLWPQRVLTGSFSQCWFEVLEVSFSLNIRHKVSLTCVWEGWGEVAGKSFSLQQGLLGSEGRWEMSERAPSLSSSSSTDISSSSSKNTWRDKRNRSGVKNRVLRITLMPSLHIFIYYKKWAEWAELRSQTGKFVSCKRLQGRLQTIGWASADLHAERSCSHYKLLVVWRRGVCAERFAQNIQTTIE